MESGLILALDLDGVVYDFITHFRKWLSGKGHDHLPVPESYNLCSEWGMDPDELNESINQAADEGVFNAGPPLPGTRELIVEATFAGIQVVAVTSRPPVEVILTSTYQWIAAWGLPFRGVNFVSSKVMVDADLLVDDDPAVYRQLMLVGETVPLIFDQPWNRDVHLDRVDVESLKVLVHLAHDALLDGDIDDEDFDGRRDLVASLVADITT